MVTKILVWRKRGGRGNQQKELTRKVEEKKGKRVEAAKSRVRLN